MLGEKEVVLLELLLALTTVVKTCVCLCVGGSAFISVFSVFLHSQCITYIPSLYLFVCLACVLLILAYLALETVLSSQK